MSIGSWITVVAFVGFIVGVIYFVRKERRLERERIASQKHSNAYRGETFDRAERINNGGLDGGTGMGG